jgi:transcription elongation factor GreA
MSKEKIKLTKKGYEKLQNELKDLEKNKRKEVAENLKKAAAYGDLSENAAYEDAKEQQSNLETKILKLKQTIKNAEIVEHDDNADWVQVGSKVTVEADGKKKEFTIVGGTESDPFEGKISCQAPLGKSLLKKPKGASCKVETPKGQKTYKILDIS